MLWTGNRHPFLSRYDAGFDEQGRIHAFVADIWSDGGWTHANAVQRLDNGDTLVSLRNFNLTAIIDPLGNLVREYDWSAYGEDTDPHDPVMLDNGNLLVCLQQDARFQAVDLRWGVNEESQLPVATLVLRERVFIRELVPARNKMRADSELGELA